MNMTGSYRGSQIIRTSSNLPISAAQSQIPIQMAFPRQQNAQYEEFDSQEVLVKNSLVNEGSVAKHLLLLVIFFSSATILFISISCVHGGCKDLVSWSRIMALFFLLLTLIKLVQFSWALAQGEMINQSILHKVLQMNRWIGIIQFIMFSFLTIALSFTLAYTNEFKDCETLYKLDFFLTIMNWLTIAFLIIAFGLQFIRNTNTRKEIQ